MPQRSTLFRIGGYLLNAACFMCLMMTSMAQVTSDPIVSKNLVFAEKDGFVAVEAEHFIAQKKTNIRAWHLTHRDQKPVFTPDGDPAHVGNASGGAYLEILPDSRRNHSEKLIPGENFSNEPGKLAILSYKIHFNETGRYYVWVRAYSTGSEDNGIHVGLDGIWPESGQRMQWCQGKNDWRWESKQRTAKNHCGEPYKIYLDIETTGTHLVQFSMREDGFEFDQFLLTKEREYKRPLGPVPVSSVHAGKRPPYFQFVRKFPDHWGEPPRIQTRDYRPLPGGFGRGSSTLAAWIQKNLDADIKKKEAENKSEDGDGSVNIHGELKQWHKVTLDIKGPFLSELHAYGKNPFLDYNMTVMFEHESGTPKYRVPGYFAGDGEAANTSSTDGNIWRAHLSPDKIGRWNYVIHFHHGVDAAINDSKSKPLQPFSGKKGQFAIQRSDKNGFDFRSKGRLEYVGERYLKFAGTGEYFLKFGPDAPETLLAYTDFDNTVADKKNAPIKTWKAHAKDWNEGDPTWKDGKGKGLIGALNYLSEKGVNTFSFLPYNAGGDGNNVWPFVSRNDKSHYDISKLDQWGIVFDHATALGLHLHFKLQENEIDDNRKGSKRENGIVTESFDGGELGRHRKLYCRELIARFAHNLALNWNIGEENTQSTEEINDMIDYIREIDPYNHNIVIHTFPNQQDEVYTPLLGKESNLTGASLQNHWDVAHQRTLKWIRESAKAGKQWVVANDEQGNASFGVPPDPGFDGFDGTVTEKSGKKYTIDDIRKHTLWGTLMAGGAGVEYYFGYQLPQNDLVAEDWRSRDKSWDYCRIAREVFEHEEIPFHRMQNHNALVGNHDNTNDKYCFANKGEVYLIYLPEGGTCDIDLSHTQRRFAVTWYNPRTGGRLRFGDTGLVQGGGIRNIGLPPNQKEEDWLVILR